MRDKKQKGPDAVKRPDPKHKAEAKHLLESKKKDLESQETQLLFLFVESQTDIVSEPMLDIIWKFMNWLKEKGYYIIDGKTVFCFPFSKLIRLKDLK